MQKNRHMSTIAQLCRAISSQLRHVSTIGKKLLKQQYLLQISLQYGELRPTKGWHLLASLGDPCKFQRVWPLGSVEQRAPPIFGRAAITLLAVRPLIPHLAVSCATCLGCPKHSGHFHHKLLNCSWNLINIVTGTDPWATWFIQICWSIWPMTHDPRSADLDGHVGRGPVPVI